MFETDKQGCCGIRKKKKKKREGKKMKAGNP
jgi:hypothetical protein